MKESDQKLTMMISRRSEEAIDVLIDSYGGLIKSVIRKQLNYNHDGLDECLDDTIMAIWENIDAFDPLKNELGQWIAAVAKYRTIDYQRKRVRQMQQEQSYGEVADHLFSDGSADIEEEFEELLAPLSPKEKKLFRQYYDEGVSSREIAKQWNVKESWVHTKLSRGRKKIKQMLLARNEV